MTFIVTKNMFLHQWTVMSYSNCIISSAGSKFVEYMNNMMLLQPAIGLCRQELVKCRKHLCVCVCVCVCVYIHIYKT